MCSSDLEAERAFVSEADVLAGRDVLGGDDPTDVALTAVLAAVAVPLGEQGVALGKPRVALGVERLDRARVVNPTGVELWRAVVEVIDDDVVGRVELGWIMNGAHCW